MLLSINSLLQVCLSCYETYIISHKHHFIHKCIYKYIFLTCFLKSSVQIKWEMKKNCQQRCIKYHLYHEFCGINHCELSVPQTRRDAFKDSMRHHGWNALFFSFSLFYLNKSRLFGFKLFHHSLSPPPFSHPPVFYERHKVVGHKCKFSGLRKVSCRLHLLWFSL